MEALATLYPDCSGQSLSVVTCHKVAHNIGIVRVSLFVLVPALVTLLVMMACAAYFAGYHEEEAEKAHEKLRQLEDEQKEDEKKRKKKKFGSPAAANRRLAMDHQMLQAREAKHLKWISPDLR